MADKFRIRCDYCDKEWTQESEGIWNIDWVCKNCDSEENTYLIEYIPEDEEFYKREVRLGNGGALDAGW
jgi:hypothetical protein